MFIGSRDAYRVQTVAVGPRKEERGHIYRRRGGRKMSHQTAAEMYVHEIERQRRGQTDRRREAAVKGQKVQLRR